MLDLELMMKEDLKLFYRDVCPECGGIPAGEIKKGDIWEITCDKCHNFWYANRLANGVD